MLVAEPASVASVFAAETGSEIMQAPACSKGSVVHGRVAETDAGDDVIEFPQAAVVAPGHAVLEAKFQMGFQVLGCVSNGTEERLPMFRRALLVESPGYGAGYSISQSIARIGCTLLSRPVAFVLADLIAMCLAILLLLLLVHFRVGVVVCFVGFGHALLVSKVPRVFGCSCLDWMRADVDSAAIQDFLLARFVVDVVASFAVRLEAIFSASISGECGGRKLLFAAGAGRHAGYYSSQDGLWLSGDGGPR